MRNFCIRANSITGFAAAWLAVLVLASPLRSGDKATPRAEESAAGHWAFRPPSRPSPPEVASGAAVVNPIDRFVLARLEAKGQSLSPPAERAALIRRVSFDVTGLPPAPEEIARFLADKSADAHEQMVDRYLASPRYGQRWGRHWLDAAGYADSNGYFSADTDRPLAHRYRDYVIRSMNDDKPLDQFIREQLAGDELSGYDGRREITPETFELLVATHFLRNSQDGTGESDGNPDEVRADKYAVLEGTAQIIGSSLLGLTVQCARCHDHKFEPISQREYYQLQSVIYPALNVQRWIKPNDRVVDAAIVRSEKRKADPPEKIAWVTDVSRDPPDVYLLERGQYNRPGEKVVPAALAVLREESNGLDVAAAAADSPRTTGRRLALARWLTRPGSRAAALLARVTANRMWQHHFGRGIVSTADNLGRSGSRPTHPELLEYLADRLARDGWKAKSLHRLMLCSAVYRQSSRPRSGAERVDPENLLLWRYPLRRLDAESVRDAMLAAAGELDPRMGGPYVPTKRTGVGEVVVDESVAGARRRSVYLQARRTQITSLLETFDAPSVVFNCTRRNTTTIPLQSLSQLNSDFARRRAKALAARLDREAGTKTAARIERAFLLTAGRSPARTERAAAEDFLNNQPGRYPGAGDAAEGAWIDFCQALLSSNAFLYVE